MIITHKTIKPYNLDRYNDGDLLPQGVKSKMIDNINTHVCDYAHLYASKLNRINGVVNIPNELCSSFHAVIRKYPLSWPNKLWCLIAYPL